ncbi:hypothetical protein BDR03DRAFT_974232 [Suillus americanus]|nr:hypothetical protein BDR03DRAFT_974232 [Suillus americanus]
MPNGNLLLPWHGKVSCLFLQPPAATVLPSIRSPAAPPTLGQSPIYPQPHAPRQRHYPGTPSSPIRESGVAHTSGTIAMTSRSLPLLTSTSRNFLSSSAPHARAAACNISFFPWFCTLHLVPFTLPIPIYPLSIVASYMVRLFLNIILLTRALIGIECLLS